MQVDFLYIKVDHDAVQVKFSDIYYIEADKRYVKIKTKGKVYMVETSLSKIEALLPPAFFCRIHRSYIISLINTKVIRHEMVVMDNGALPVGREYRDALLTRVILISRDTGNGHKPSQNDLNENVKNIKRLLG